MDGSIDCFQQNSSRRTLKTIVESSEDEEDYNGTIETSSSYLHIYIYSYIRNTWFH